MPHLCWIYNDDIHQECICIHTCAVDMLNALPTDKGETLLVAHNSDYDCRFILECLHNFKHIVKSGRSLQIQATYYNPKAKNSVNTTGKDFYKLIPMPLRDFGKCVELDVDNEVMPYNVYTYENVNMGACSIHPASAILKMMVNNIF